MAQRRPPAGRQGRLLSGTGRVSLNDRHAARSGGQLCACLMSASRRIAVISAVQSIHQKRTSLVNRSLAALHHDRIFGGCMLVRGDRYAPVFISRNWVTNCWGRRYFEGTLYAMERAISPVKALQL
jgi:hypothetical protein